MHELGDLDDLIEKDPDEELTYHLDWTKWLVEGDTIASATWEVPPGLTQLSSNHAAKITSIKLAGGILGNTYRVSSKVTTASGEIGVRSLFLFIKPQ